MKKCKDIKDSLPLYMDDSLSDADKQTVEEHLKSCPRCSKALGELSKTKSLVNNLAEVEPPPWFKQRIISRIREEAEKKSLLQKWFYPVRIKIPVQIMATIVIAVLAVYIYRSGNEQINAVLPPSATAPVVEAQKGQIPEQKIKKPIDKTIREDYSQQEKAASRKPVSQAAVDKVIDINEQVVSGIKDDRYESAPAADSRRQIAARNGRPPHRLRCGWRRAPRRRRVRLRAQRPGGRAARPRPGMRWSATSAQSQPVVTRPYSHPPPRRQRYRFSTSFMVLAYRI